MDKKYISAVLKNKNIFTNKKGTVRNYVSI